jgi:hypothetical protein
MEKDRRYERVIESMNQHDSSGFSLCIRDVVPHLTMADLMSCAVVAAEHPTYPYLDLIVMAMNERKRPQFLENAIQSAPFMPSAGKVVRTCLQRFPGSRWQRNDNSGLTPMQAAAKAGAKSILESIFEKLDPNEPETSDERFRNGLNEAHVREGTALENAMKIPSSGRAIRRGTVEYLLSKHIELDILPRRQFMDLVVDTGDITLLNDVLCRGKIALLLNDDHLVYIIEKGSPNAWRVAMDYCSDNLASMQKAKILHTAVKQRHLDAVEKILKVHAHFVFKTDDSKEENYPIKHLTPRETDSADTLRTIRQHLLSAILRQEDKISEVKTMFRVSNGKQQLIYKLT